MAVLSDYFPVRAEMYCHGQMTFGRGPAEPLYRIQMPLAVNDDIAGRLDEVARIPQEQGANRFRVQAYHRAASTLRRLVRPISEIFAAEGLDGLENLSGVGESIGERYWQHSGGSCTTILVSKLSRTWRAQHMTDDWRILWDSAQNGLRAFVIRWRIDWGEFAGNLLQDHWLQNRRLKNCSMWITNIARKPLLID